MKSTTQIALGGGCHWCTEAVFQQLKGVYNVQQGYIASTGENNNLSEGILFEYNPEEISLERLIYVHLSTHKSTSNHSFRKKYRSAVYYFSDVQEKQLTNTIASLQKKFNEKIITKVLAFVEFKASRESIQNYYTKNPDSPFCKRYIIPKLDLIKKIIKIRTTNVE